MLVEPQLPPIGVPTPRFSVSECVPLSRANLSRLPSAIGLPTYDVTQVQTGIVHLGPGAFHRAHMARYTHDLMQQQPAALEWGIAIAGLQGSDARVCKVLAAQDSLYSLVERQDEEEVATVIGVLTDVIFAGETSTALLAKIDQPGVRIVSLTVTEHGYCLNPATKQLDFGHPAIKHDIQQPGDPRSAIGILTAAFARRREAGAPGFTAMTCDNIQHNGNVLRAATLALAERQDPSLVGWIIENASFPNTMVDRITPGTTPEDVAYLASFYGVADAWPVSSELFKQWVVEDNFIQGRPDWAAVGAQFVEDVTPYEYMKLRLLNCSHLAVATLGQLAGYTYVDETVRDPAFRAYMQRLMDEETGPTLPDVPGVDLAEYKAELVARFANSRVKDTLQRINTDAPLNLLLDPIRDRLAAGQPAELLGLALAAWIRRLGGVDDNEQPLEINFPKAMMLQGLAKAAGTDPLPIMGLPHLFGDLAKNDAFVETVGRHLARLDRLGTHVVVSEIVHRAA